MSFIHTDGLIDFIFSTDVNHQIIGFLKYNVNVVDGNCKLYTFLQFITANIFEKPFFEKKGIDRGNYLLRVIL